MGDLKHAFHMFIKNPGFTIAVIAALALGIGADTAIFSVVNAVLLKPLGYPEPDRIVQILLTGPGGEGPGASATKFEVWREQTNVFSDVAGYNGGGGIEPDRWDSGAGTWGAGDGGVLPGVWCSVCAGAGIYSGRG